MRKMRYTVTFLLAVVLAFPALAYKIYLKDGSVVVAKEKYKVVGDQAIIILNNGTQVSYSAAEIDTERTENSNDTDYGAAVVVQDGKSIPLAKTPAPVAKKETLSDLIKKRKAGIRRPEESRSPEPKAAPDVPKGPEATATGAIDFSSLEKSAYSNLEIVGEIQQYFRSQGVADIEVFRGTENSRPMIQIVADSESAVFRALTVASSALLEVQARRGRELTGLDLLLMSSATSRAGQFSLNPAMAEELTSKQIEAASFFVKYVDF